MLSIYATLSNQLAVSDSDSKHAMNSVYPGIYEETIEPITREYTETQWNP